MAQYNRSIYSSPATKTDEFISFFQKLTLYFFKHQIKFYAVVATVILGLMAYGFYLFYHGRRIQAFAMDYYQAQISVGADKLKNWEKIENQKPPAPLAQVVALQTGNSLAGAQDWNKAALSFDQARTATPLLLRTLATLAAGVALENAGGNAAALPLYEQISVLKDNPFQDEASYARARVLLKLGKIAEGKKLLESLASPGFSASPAIQAAATSRLLLLALPQPQ